MAFECPTPKKTDSKNNKFYVDCSIKVFEQFLSHFYNVENEYLSHINQISDPILKYVSLYLVQYYIDGYKYYHNSDSTHRTEACRYLNRWLLEKKDLFTYGGKCEKKLYLWENKIGTLWKRLISDYKKFSNSGNAWCFDYNLTLKTNFPDVLTSPNCEERISQESSSTYVPPLTVTEKCECLQNADHEIPSQAVQPPETDRTKNLVVTSGFTAFGTLGTLLVLYKFTPMSSWFRRRGMNNVGTDIFMGTGAADNFLRMQHDNGGNNLFYHSSIE